MGSEWLVWDEMRAGLFLPPLVVFKPVPGMVDLVKGPDAEIVLFGVGCKWISFSNESASA